MKVLPWVGGLRVGYRRSRPGTLDLGDLGQRQRIVAECRGLMDEGFDGIHVNVEPIANGDDEFLALLRALRTAIGRRHPLRVRRPSRARSRWPSRPTSSGRPPTTRSSADAVDQVVIMAYDSALPTPSPLPPLRLLRGLRRSRRSFVRSSAHARAGRDPDLRRTTGSCTARAWRRRRTRWSAWWPACAAGAGGTFEGVALYAEWTTDPADWEVYERVWRGHTVP